MNYTYFWVESLEAEAGVSVLAEQQGGQCGWRGLCRGSGQETGRRGIEVVN